MPNSRIETSNFLSDDQLELLGAWTTSGNTLQGGGGDELGSNDNFGWFFITNSIKRGGFFNSGEFFLSQNGSNPDHRRVSKVLRFQTLDDSDQVEFTFNMPDKTVYHFDATFNYRNQDGTIWGRLRRSILVNREGAILNISPQTFLETERFGNFDTDMNFLINGTTVELTFNGVDATNLIWTGLVRYQGVLNL